MRLRAGRLPDLEVLGLDRAAVETDLDTVAADGQAAGLRDVELGLRGPGRNRLGPLLDDLAVYVGRIMRGAQKKPLRIGRPGSSGDTALRCS